MAFIVFYCFFTLTLIAGLTRNLLSTVTTLCLGDGGSLSAMTVGDGFILGLV